MCVCTTEESNDKGPKAQTTSFAKPSSQLETNTDQTEETMEVIAPKTSDSKAKEDTGLFSGSKGNSTRLKVTAFEEGKLFLLKDSMRVNEGVGLYF